MIGTVLSVYDLCKHSSRRLKAALHITNSSLTPILILPADQYKILEENAMKIVQKEYNLKFIIYNEIERF